MSRARSLLLAVAVLIAMIPLMSSPSILGATQHSNKPIVLPVDETFLAPNLTSRCGFDVWAHVSGTFTVKGLPSGMELHKIRYQHVFTGPGGSVTVNRVENVKYSATTAPDGTLVETITVTGTLPYHFVVPGHGTIGNNSGREILEISWQYDEGSKKYVEVDFQVLSDAGPNNALSDADFALICEQLA